MYRVLWYVSNSPNFGIIEINNSSKCLGERGCDDLKVHAMTQNKKSSSLTSKA